MDNEQLDRNLREKVEASDLVQETFLEAQRGIDRFHGSTEGELLAWLRCILLHNLADVRRRFSGAGKRDISREVRIRDQTDSEQQQQFADREESPRAQLIGREQAESLRTALNQLLEISRRLIEWRNYELRPFAEIGERLGKTEDAARKAWARTVEQLQQILEAAAE